MADGMGAVGLGAGFAKALSAVMLGNRQEMQRRRERQEEVDFRNFATTLPIVLQNFQQNPTPEGAAALEDMLVKINPDLKKSIKRSGFSFETLGPLLNQMEGGGAGGAQQPGGVPGMPQQQTEIIPGTTGIPRQVAAQPQQPLLEAKHGAMVGMPDPTVRFFGAPVLTADQRAEAEITKGRRLSAAEIQGKIDTATRMFRSGQTKTLAEAFDRVGLRQTTSGATASRFGGVLKGDQAPPGATDNSGRPIDPNQYYRTQIQPNGDILYTPTVPPGGAGGGDFLTRAAIKMGYRNAAEVPVEKRQELFKFASEIETEESRATSYGSGVGDFQAPLTLPEAQAVPGAVVGSSSADYAGQTPATQQQAQRRETATLIKSQLDHIKTLLKALPSDKELAGLAPGAANAARRRLPAYRNAYTQLESAINNIRASLTRTMQSNVGTETERDAERALSTIADFEGRLLDPLKGDTQESATLRLNETIAYLEEVLKGVPGPVVPNAKPAPGTPAGRPDSARPAGQPYKDEQGNWVIP